jgi:hypothetical protein
MDLGLGLVSTLFGRPRAAFAKTLSLTVVAGALAGCSGDNGPGAPLAAAAELTDANNYTSTSGLMPKEIVTASGADLDISWDQLTVDMQCHGMSPTEDIDKVALLRFRDLTKEEAAQRLTAGELQMSEIDGYIQYDTAKDNSETSCKLSQLTNVGTPVDITQEYKAGDGKVYMLLWGTGTRPGLGARTMAFLRPVVDELVKEVHAEPGCDPSTGEGILSFDATFHDPVEIPEGQTVVDWRQVTLDGLQNKIAANSIDRVLLAYYEGKTPTELAENIFDIEIDATDIWEIRDFGGRGRRADLTSARHREADGTQGDYFDGFGGRPEGTWLLGLMCSLCQNPAPMVLSVLNPAGQ